MEPIPIPQDETASECNQICMKLYSKLMRKKISMEEFKKEIAYTAINYGFDELEYYPFKVIMPKVLREYYHTDPKNRHDLPSFWQRDDVKKYMDAKIEHEGSMISNYAWLIELRSRFSKYGDQVNTSKCSQAIRMFPRDIVSKYTPTKKRGENGKDKHEKKDPKVKKPEVPF